jgi:hypothetical protein
MIVRSVKCTFVNETGEALTLDADASKPTDGAWAPAPPAQCDGQAEFSCVAEGSANGARGQARYTGPSGDVVVSFWNPLEGSNDFNAVATGTYDAGFTAAQGRDATVTYTVRKKTNSDADQDGMPSAVDSDPAADDHTHQSHTPLRASGPVVLSPKLWLVDIAWQAVNHLEWDPVILEITENRHGEGGGGACPRKLVFIEGVQDGSPGFESCKKQHSGSRDDDFHSWCGDYVTWVFWKAWMLKKGSQPDEDTRKILVKGFNREALRSVDPELQQASETWKQDKRSVKEKGSDPAKWQSGKNLSMLEDFAKDSAANGGLLAHHPFDPQNPDAYEPRPGDVLLCNRSAGGHIDIVAYYDPKPIDGKNHKFITLDGKSFDLGQKAFDWGAGADPAPKDKKEADDRGWNNPRPGHPEEGMPPAPVTRVSSTADRTQGVVETQHQTNDKVKDSTDYFCRAWIDTSKLRERLGYR